MRYGCTSNAPTSHTKSRHSPCAIESALDPAEQPIDHPGKWLDADVIPRLRSMLLRSYVLDADAEERELTPPACERLNEIRVPTLVLTGALDVPDMQAQSDLIVAGIAGAEKRQLADCAHLPNLERPAELTRVVLEFLDRAT